MRPSSEAELAEMISSASTPLRVRGGGTRLTGEFAGEVLETSGLSGITLYEPGALTLVAQAGTPLVEIEAALTKENQRLAFDPPDLRAALGLSGNSTIGGVAASNASGPRRISSGACRDFMLGVRFVDGAGTVVKNGGRVMKNVTGYDLVKLMSGAHGTLGVLSEVSLKVMPIAETQATLVFVGCGWAATSEIFTQALNSPFEVSAAARLPAGTRGNAKGVTLLRVEGFDFQVKHRVQRLAELFRFAPDHIETRAEVNSTLWSDVRDVKAFPYSENDLWKISVKPTDMQRVAAALDKGHEQVSVDWAGGLIWTEVAPNTNVRAKLAGIAGHATLMRASAETFAKLGRFHPEPAPLARISAGLRARFDPKGLFNPRLMGGTT